MLSREQVAAVVTGRGTYYDAMRRHGWILPAKTMSLCTLDFMERVRAGEIFCPRAEHIKAPAICLTPPPKADLIEKIDIACAERFKKGEDTSALEKLLERLLNKKEADTAFLVQVLHLVDPLDAIFARDYGYVRPARVKTAATLPLVNNEDGFFSGLPRLDPNKPGNKRPLRLTKAQRDAMQLELLE